MIKAGKMSSKKTKIEGKDCGVAALDEANECCRWVAEE